MRKFMNFGVLAILGIIATLGPSRTKELKDDVDDIHKIEVIKNTVSYFERDTDKRIKVNNNKITVTETVSLVTIINNSKS